MALRGWDNNYQQSRNFLHPEGLMCELDVTTSLKMEMKGQTLPGTLQAGNIEKIADPYVGK